MFSLVDGVATDSVPVTDSTVLRGDGCFESIRSYGGWLFGLDLHLDRLERSAHSLGISLPPRHQIEEWCERIAKSGGDGVVRVVMSRGDAVPRRTSGPRCIVLHHELPPRPASVRLLAVTAPWHPAGRNWELAGTKSVSYAPNLAAGRTAQARGFDDALLVSEDDVVLEGPTFTVAWVRDGTVETPSLDLLILDSITRRLMLAAAAQLDMPVLEGSFEASRMLGADEVMALSTTKEVMAVTAVGDQNFDPGATTAKLASAVGEMIDQEIRSQGGPGR